MRCATRQARRRLTAFLVLLLAGCGGAAGARSRPVGRLLLVATTTQVADFSRVVGGERVEVRGLLGPNVDAHDFEPSPADLEAIAQAQVVVISGAVLERWFDDVLRAAQPKGRVVDASAGVRLRGEDPHIWTDPRNAKLMATHIAEGLEAADPEGATGYRSRLDAYLARLDRLDLDIESQLSSLINRKLVTNHDTLGYYCDRYHLEFVGSVIPSFDSSAEMSARDMSDLVARIRAQGVKAVFSETSIPAKTATAIAQQAGVKVVDGEGALFGDSLGPPGSDGATYVQMMEHNTRTIVENLR